MTLEKAFLLVILISVSLGSLPMFFPKRLPHVVKWVGRVANTFNGMLMGIILVPVFPYAIVAAVMGAIVWVFFAQRLYELSARNYK